MGGKPIEFTQWKHQLETTANLHNEVYRIPNPAKCAIESKRPAEGLFIMVNGIDIAKSAYRQALSNNYPISQYVKEVVYKYFQTVVEVSKYLLTSLVSGKLSLLDQDSYKKIMSSCPDQELFCQPAHDYIVGLLKKSNPDKWSFSRKKKFSIDCSMTEELDTEIPLKNNTLIDQGYLADLANGILTSTHSKKDCNDIAVELDQKLVENKMFKISLNGLRPLKFKKIGFTFWSSFKIYLSHFFRAPELLRPYAGAHTRIFNSITLENSIFLMSNSCKTLEPPACDQDTVGDRDLKALTDPEYLKKDTGSNVFNIMPNPLVNRLMDGLSSPTDHLNVKQYDNADSWLKNFFDNFSKTSGYLKKKIIDIKKYDRDILPTLTSRDYIQALKDELKLTNHAYPINEEIDNQKIFSNIWQTYYLCSEVFVLNDKDLSPYKTFVHQALDLSWETQGLTKDYLKNRATEYRDIISQLESFCWQLQKDGFWNEHTVSREHGLSAWFQKIIFDQVNFEPSVNEAMLVQGAPLMAKDDFFEEPIHAYVSCYNTAHCIRQFLDRTIDLLIVFNHHRTFLTTSEVSFNSMNNDWSDRYQCKLYDPWRKVKRGIRHLAFDVVNAALFGLAGIPLYASGDLIDGEVTSFDQMIKDGRLVYSPKRKRKKVEGSLLLNLSSFTGIPCTVAIGNVAGAGHLNYMFTGLSIKTCNSTTRGVISSQGAGDLGQSDPRSFSACLICYLNFESVINSTAFFLSKLGPWSPLVYLARGVYRMAKEFMDPLHFPRTWSVDSQNLVDTYRRYGEIPKRCVRSLRTNRACLDSLCLEQISDKLAKNNSYINSHRMLYQSIEVKTNKDQVISYNIDRGDNMSCDLNRRYPYY